MDPAYFPPTVMLGDAIATAYPRTTSIDSARLDQVPEMAGFLRANNLRQDIRVCNEQGVKGFTAVGCNLEIGNNPPYILFEKSLLTIEPEGTRFFLKKTCFQIQRNQKLFIKMIMTIDLIFMTFLMKYVTSGGTFNSGFAMGILTIAQLLLLYGRLDKIGDFAADKFAIKNSTVAELQGAIKILIGLGKMKSNLADNILHELTKRESTIPLITKETIDQHARIYA